MKSSNKIKTPNIVRGGIAIPLGRTNFYYMKGRKHEQGGIDIGKNPRTGLEVEDGEVMHITDKNIKVFSSVPFLNGKSPAQKVLEGDNPSTVFNQQENYKDRNNINDDGTKKYNKNMNNKKYKTGGLYSVTINGKTRLRPFPSTGGQTYMKCGGRKKAKLGMFEDDELIKFTPTTDTIAIGKGVVKPMDIIINTTTPSITRSKSIPILNTNDIIGTGANIIGSITSNAINRSMLNDLQYPDKPISVQPAKLKTNVNINPQLDKIREASRNYERDVDANTSSSRVGLARKQRIRLADMLNTNELYANKENRETELINQDRLNRQEVSARNIESYNAWKQGKINFENTIRENKSENDISLISTINRGIQDILSNDTKRKTERQNRLALLAAYPNVNPRILKMLGITGITDTDISNWEKAYGKRK